MLATVMLVTMAAEVNKVVVFPSIFAVKYLGNPCFLCYAISCYTDVT